MNNENLNYSKNKDFFYFFLNWLFFVLIFFFLSLFILNKFVFNKYRLSLDEKKSLSSSYVYLKKNNDKDNYILSGKRKIVIQISLNENLFSVLSKNGFLNENINEVLYIIGKKVNLKNLKENQHFFIEYSFNSKFKDVFTEKNKNFLPKKLDLFEIRKIDKISFKIPKDAKYIVERNKEKYILHIEKPKLSINTHIISGVIQNSVFKDALVSGIKPNTLYNILNEYAFLIDFQRDIRPDDKFTFILETTIDVEGDFVGEKVLYSNLNLSKKNYEIFNFNNRYYDRQGKSIQKNLLKTPIDGARVSSGFSTRRKHPILGYTRKHAGIDLAAAIGTPIYASGDGVITDIQLNHKSYGKVITIKHNREYSTRYAHMSRVAPLKTGQRVKQRQVIGYVGKTGLATGPHLHYEVLQYGKHINPKNVKAVETKKLDQGKIEEFKLCIKKIDDILNL